MSLKMAKMGMTGTIAYEELLGVSISPSKVISLWDRASSTGYLFLKETNEFIKYVESTNTFTRWTWDTPSTVVQDIAINKDGTALFVATKRFTFGSLYHMSVTGDHTVTNLGESRLSDDLSMIVDSFDNIYLWGNSQEDGSRSLEKGHIDLASSPRYNVLYREWVSNSCGFDIGRSGKIYLERINSLPTEVYIDTGYNFALESDVMPKTTGITVKHNTGSVVWIDSTTIRLTKLDGTEVVYPTVFPVGATPFVMSVIENDIYMCESRVVSGQPYTEHIVKYTISGDEATISAGTVIATTGGLRSKGDPYGERREQFTLKYS